MSKSYRPRYHVSVPFGWANDPNGTIYYKAISRIGASKAMALNITYTAWAMILALILDVILHISDSSHGIAYPSPLTIVCTVVVLVCSIFAAADFKEIFAGKE